MANKVSIKNGERCRFYNMLPEYGTLATAHMTRIMRYELLDKLSDQQRESRGISKNELGQYVCEEEKKNFQTDMTLTEESLQAFKSFIERMSAANSVYYIDEPLFSQIIESNLEEQL